MPRISKPTDNIKDRVSEDTPFCWSDFVTDIIKGKYVLLVGSEVILQKQYGDGDSHKDILDSIVLDLMLLPIVEIQASSIGGYPDMPCILNNHRIDREIIIGSWKFRRIEESTDTKASLVDTITSMRRSHCNTLFVWRLHDTLNFIDW